MRPHEFEIRRVRNGTPSFPGRVVRTHSAGSLARISVETESGRTVLVELSLEEFNQLGTRRRRNGVPVSQKRTRVRAGRREMNHATGHEAAAHLFSGKVLSMTRHDIPLPTAEHAGARQLPTEEELREIAASLRGLRYGSVSIVVQDGVIIQIDRVEKRRLRNRREGADAAR